MNKKTISAVGLMAIMLASAGHATETLENAYLKQSKGMNTEQVDQSATQKEYASRLAAYHKDLTAYEADPTIWTAEIPVKPVQPTSGPAAAGER